MKALKLERKYDFNKSRVIAYREGSVSIETKDY